MSMQHTPELVIYIMPHCEVCDYALETAAWLRDRYPQLSLRVVDLADPQEPVPEIVFATPTYVLDGRVWSLGNPSRADAMQKLDKLLA
jgi:hypothetical protein